MKDDERIEVKKHLLEQFGAALPRITLCIETAKKLEELELYGFSVVADVMVMEMTIRDLILRPLVAGSFLLNVASGEILEVLLNRIITRQISSSKALLKPALMNLGVVMEPLKVNGKEYDFWKAFDSSLASRNAFVHKAEPVTKQNAELARACGVGLLESLKKLAQEHLMDD